MNNVYDGYNSTLFAYGQTGSGKSWTIEGGENEQGVLQIALKEIWNVKNK